MWKFIIIMTVLRVQLICALPLEEVTEKTVQIQTTTGNVETQRTVDVSSYIQNFKNIMAEYVNTQYKNLTVNDMEKIKTALEGFLINFANDLRDTVQSPPRNTTVREPIQDGVPDSTFVEIKNRMKNEFPDIEDETADEIVFKLRNNLLITRRKIDTIINDSEKDEMEALD